MIRRTVLIVVLTCLVLGNAFLGYRWWDAEQRVGIENDLLRKCIGIVIGKPIPERGRL